MNEAKFGFEMRRIRVRLEDILPVRQVKNPQKAAGRYHTILASIREVGLIEPLMIHPQKGMPGKYLLLDGHMRHHALRELGETEADCLISTQDESYTYNARVNRLNPIQEHKMITRAVKNGVPPERIAAALNLPLVNIRASIIHRRIGLEQLDPAVDRLVNNLHFASPQRTVEMHPSDPYRHTAGISDPQHSETRLAMYRAAVR
ncbi:MAG: ParB N-terminal domain-containing protein [Verrucomicrobia bacterium]|nr:ParB N-terminal domain-containing protein [Verrucomicrobiota bacterium]